MKWWPIKKFTVISPLSAVHFASELLSHTERNASGYYWYRREGISFLGEVTAKEFSVIKTVPYWNLSPVKINGEFLFEEKPLVINIKMHNPFTLPVIILVIVVLAGILYNYMDNPPWWLITGIVSGFYLILNVPFQIEAEKAKNLLLEISLGSITNIKK